MKFLNELITVVEWAKKGFLSWRWSQQRPRASPGPQKFEWIYFFGVRCSTSKMGKVRSIWGIHGFAGVLSMFWALTCGICSGMLLQLQGWLATKIKEGLLFSQLDNRGGWLGESSLTFYSACFCPELRVTLWFQVASHINFVTSCQWISSTASTSHGCWVYTQLSGWSFDLTARFFSKERRAVYLPREIVEHTRRCRQGADNFQRYRHFRPAAQLQVQLLRRLWVAAT